MKKILPYIFISTMLLVGCQGTLTHRIQTDRGPIYVGMVGPELSAHLGPPDDVGSGRFGCTYALDFALLPSGSTIEWAWTRRNPIIVAWLEGGSAVLLGTLPK